MIWFHHPQRPLSCRSIPILPRIHATRPFHVLLPSPGAGGCQPASFRALPWCHLLRGGLLDLKSLPAYTPPAILSPRSWQDTVQGHHQPACSL